MKRKEIIVNNHKISFLDNEKSGKVLICLHGHFGCGSMFSFMQTIFETRVILIDQRGHGNSEKCSSYRINDYMDDLVSFCVKEKIVNPILLGHSLGGTVIMHYAAENKNVEKLIIEDIGTEVECSNEFILKLPKYFSSLYEVEKAFESINMEFDQYFAESIRYDGEKWKFQFDYNDMVESQINMNGNHWEYWDKIEVPILLLHGEKSWASNTKNILEMKKRKTETQLIIYKETGHTLHDEKREQYCKDVKSFIYGTNNK
jgi:esterase